VNRTTAAPDTPPDAAARLRARNRRTAAILASIAAVFFCGVIVAKYLGGAVAGMTVVGIAVLLYLAVAIGRNLRGRGGPADRSGEAAQ
jgi:ABC-type Mn2+/Zn2+ transport system permease subunit